MPKSYIFLLPIYLMLANFSQAATEPQMEEVTIEASAEKKSTPKTENLKVVAGAGNDILKAIESLPGVTMSGDGLGGEPVIRGSSPIDNQYYVNGVRVGYVFHNDGDSIFNPNLVDNFNLYAGAWAAPLSNAIGGVITVDLDAPDLRQRDSDNITIFDVGFTRVSLMHAHQISENQRVYFSMRESLLFIYIDALFDEDTQDEEGFSFSQVPRNRDYQFSYSWDINDTVNLEFFASGAKDFVGLAVENDADIAKKNPDLAGDLSFDTAYNNQALILTINERNYNANWRLNALQEVIDIQLGSALTLDGTNYNNSLVIDYLFPLSSQGELLVGVDLVEEAFDYKASGRSQPCNDEFQSCPPGFIAPIISSQDKIKTQMPSLYFDYAWTIANPVQVNLGANINYNSYTEETYVEPRVAIEWFIDNQASAWLRYGQHHQWFKNYEYSYLLEGFGSDNLELVESEHTVLGFGQDANWGLAGNIYWQLEAYYKSLDKLIVGNPAAQTNTGQAANTSVQPYINGATGEAWGLELLIRKDLSEQWQGWITMAYSETSRFNEATDESFNFEYDQPIIINLVSAYQIHPRISLSAKWRYQSGRLYTDIIGSTAVNDINNNLIAYDPTEGEINGKRFSASHRLDLRADFIVSYGTPALGWRKPRIVAYIELLNAYGQKNQSGWEYEEDYLAREAEYSFPETVLPSFGMTFTF